MIQFYKIKKFLEEKGSDRNTQHLNPLLIILKHHYNFEFSEDVIHENNSFISQTSKWIASLVCWLTWVLSQLRSSGRCPHRHPSCLPNIQGWDPASLGRQRLWLNSKTGPSEEKKVLWSQDCTGWNGTQRCHETELCKMPAWVMTTFSVSKLDKFKFLIKIRRQISLGTQVQFKWAYLHSVFNNTTFFLHIVKLCYNEHICRFYLYSNLEDTLW